jgi:hypothetical protein
MSRLAYAAHTRTAVFFLDEEGVCQEVEPVNPDEPTAPESALRCIGAQYVAALDLSSPGGLVATPSSGAQMLFVLADAHMHFSLVRTGPLERFEALATLDDDDVVSDDDELSEDDLEEDSETLRPPAPALEFARVNVSWPKGDMLARALPQIPYRLSAPPRPLRRMS